MISWEGNYSSSNHGMNYHPYRYLKLKFFRGEREYVFEFSSDPRLDYGSDSVGTPQQMADVVLLRIQSAAEESLEGELSMGEYEWEVGYRSLGDFLCEHKGKKIKIQVLSDE